MPKLGALLGRMTTWLLVAAVAALGAAATPAFLAASTGGAPISESPTPLRLAAPPPEVAGEGPDSLDPTTEPDEDEALPELPGQLGQTRKTILLRERPAPSSTVMGQVSEGEVVSILRVAGDWALVYYGGSENLVAGWAKKSEIAIR